MRLGSLPRFTGWVALVPLAYFAAEWIVSASWRGLYGYRDQLIGPLGVAFCGPRGDWPCSDIYPVMNAALLLTGMAVAVVAVGLHRQRRADRGTALLLLVAGLSLAVSGAIAQNVSYPVNLTATVVFMTLGSVSALLLAVSPAMALSGERRTVAVAAGLTSVIGFFCYSAGLDVLGPGGAQRATIYGILAVVITVGTAGVGSAEPGEPAETGRLVAGVR